jgi:hypothetical protein
MLLYISLSEGISALVVLQGLAAHADSLASVNPHRIRRFGKWAFSSYHGARLPPERLVPPGRVPCTRALKHLRGIAGC